VHALPLQTLPIDRSFILSSSPPRGLPVVLSETLWTWRTCVALSLALCTYTYIVFGYCCKLVIKKLQNQISRSARESSTIHTPASRDDKLWISFGKSHRTLSWPSSIFDPQCMCIYMFFHILTDLISLLSSASKPSL